MKKATGITRERDRKLATPRRTGGGPEPNPGLKPRDYIDRGGQIPAALRREYREQGVKIPRVERMYYRSIAPKPGHERPGFLFTPTKPKPRDKPVDIPRGGFKPKPPLRDPDKPYTGPGVPRRGGRVMPYPGPTPGPLRDPDRPYTGPGVPRRGGQSGFRGTGEIPDGLSRRDTPAQFRRLMRQHRAMPEGGRRPPGGWITDPNTGARRARFPGTPPKGWRGDPNDPNATMSRKPVPQTIRTALRGGFRPAPPKK